MKKLLSGVAFLALVVAIVLYAAGVFGGERIEPRNITPPPGLPPPPQTTTAERAAVAVHEDAVGTIESRIRVAVAAQVTARVVEVDAEAGATVEAEQPIVVLDDRELAARRAQAREGLRQAQAARDRAAQSKASAEAVLVQAKKRHERVKSMLEAMAATPEQMEIAEAAYLQAQAGVAEAEAAIAAAAAGIQQAEQVLAETEVAYGHARILAPIDGVVAVKSVEPGDLAWPGKTLLEILDPDDLRLEAQVREGLIGNVERGGAFEVRIPALGRTVTGTVSEVCPTADPQSRTFKVRVDLDDVPGLRPGMFGRLRLPLGRREVVRVPEAAVSRTGQLASVLVEVEGRWERRMVTTGQALPDETVEVLSGLAGGEVVGLQEAE